ncbi:VOC family protein [Actinomycetospora lemnae]|uniref:VOC family protein n=1 Tax=Actinomycetospora lemnae TaxID=3019891 RepID=A0ABT5STA7_9PSEU|nr:VOC family protein [Actinomycetospora sp. DW7H6]MDD7965989.1 VOC family protein [Actinomycetospora sp. DW7H6]
MLSRFPLNPVLPAADGRRARAFYRDVLGLTLVSGPDDDPMMFTAAEGTRIIVTEIPDRRPAPYPVVAFLVAGLHEIVDELLTRGVSFYDPGAERGSFAGRGGRAEGVVTDYGPVRSAWLYDSEGNLLALNEIVG